MRRSIHASLASGGLAILLAAAAPVHAQSAVPSPAAVSTPPASAPEPSAQIAGIENEIAEAEAELAQYDGGLVVALIQARIETLKLTRAILQNQVAAAKGEATTEITVPVGAPDPERAAEILAEINTQMKVIEEAEDEAANTGGLVGAIAISRVLTEKMTLASMRAAWMAAEYGSILPVNAPAMASSGVASVASTASAEPAPAAGKPDVAPPEWADPDNPEIDYTADMFAQLHHEGFKIHGWWGLIESRADIDDSPQVMALNVSTYKGSHSLDNPTLQIICREGEAMLVYDTDDFIQGDFRSSTIETAYRVDDNPAQTGSWSKLSDNSGSGLFGARGQSMIRDLYDAEKIFLRIEDRGRHDATFQLAGIKPVAEAVARSCSFSLLDLSQDDYRTIQTMLNAAGYDAGKPDGVWGKESAAALRQWQEQNGLDATGAPDRVTLEAMGLETSQG